MNTIEALTSRRTAHHYTKEPVPQDWVVEALEAAIRAPNHKLTNPWRFFQIGAQTRPEIVEIALEAKRAFREITSADEAAIRSKVGDSSVLILVGQALAKDELRRKEDYASVACAIQNFSLAMWDHGVATKWSTGPFVTHEKTYELLGIDPKEIELVGAVFAGYPKVIPQTPRTPLSEVFRVLP